jgi:transposase
MEDARKPTYEELLIENVQLKNRVVDLEQRLAELQAQVDKLTQMLFGKKSEKSKKPKEEKAEQHSSEPKQPRKNNGGGGRKPFPPEIPRRDVRVPLYPTDCRCPICGKDYVSMGAETTEVLNYIPMVLEVLRFIRERMKAACSCLGTKIIIAEMPIRNLDKGSVTTEFIAAVLVNKYCDHLPIHRQVNRLFKSAKVGIAESSVCRWRDTVADQL